MPQSVSSSYPGFVVLRSFDRSFTRSVLCSLVATWSFLWKIHFQDSCLENYKKRFQAA